MWTIIGRITSSENETSTQVEAYWSGNTGALSFIIDSLYIILPIALKQKTVSGDNLASSRKGIRR